MRYVLPLFLRSPDRASTPARITSATIWSRPIGHWWWSWRSSLRFSKHICQNITYNPSNPSNSMKKKNYEVTVVVKIISAGRLVKLLRLHAEDYKDDQRIQLMCLVFWPLVYRTCHMPPETARLLQLLCRLVYDLSSTLHRCLKKFTSNL